MALIDALNRNGFALGSILDSAGVDDLIREWNLVAERHAEHEAMMRHADGPPYGARNLLELWLSLADWVVASPLAPVVSDVLGARAGLVRALFFDKPPDHSWALPWHKDLTVAVRAHRAGGGFTKPTVKAGIPHAEAPLTVLESMLTARIHLDAVDGRNGALKVLPRSHLSGKALQLSGEPVSVFAERGQVLWMRPLLAHASGHTVEGTTSHRRVLHLEFASSASLPDEWQWRHFVPLGHSAYTDCAT